MKRGLIFVNFKGYEESIGKNALNLAKKLDHEQVFLIVNAVDLKDVLKTVKKSKVFVEHVDSLETGAFTGAITFPEIKKAKAYGVLLNHSEKKINFEMIKKGINLAKKYHLKSIVSSSTLNEAEKISTLHPDYVALEVPALISGNISVSEAQPGLIKTASQKIKNLIVGAGIHSSPDVEKSLVYGAKGVLVSSAIVKSKHPKEKIKELLDGLKI